MRTRIAMLSYAALAVGTGLMGSGCGKSNGARITDAGVSLDAAKATGGAGSAASTGATSSGAGGATNSSGQSTGDATSSTTATGPSASGGTSGGSGSGGAQKGSGASTGGAPGTGGTNQDGGVSDASGSGRPDANPPKSCELWQTRSPDQDTLDVLQYGFFKAATVLEGTLGDLTESGSVSNAALTVNRVRAGIISYEGLECDVHMDRALYEQLGKGARLTLGFNQPHPLQDTGVKRPVWDQPQAAIAKASTLPAEVLDFHAWNTPNVAVARVEEILDGGIKFTLVESLRGNLPASFLISVSSMWPTLGLTVGSTWIGGFSEPAKVPTGSPTSVSLLELRPNTPEARASVMTALQSLDPQGFATQYQADLERQKTEAISLRLGWMYNQSDAVASVEVTGIAGECCTGAGGIYHAGSVVEILAGQKPAGQLLTGGHAYYAKKACGDRFLYALGSPFSLADGLEYDCAGKGTISTTKAPTPLIHELPATAENLALARQWVASSPPLLRLYPAGKDFAAGAFAPPAATAFWSTPVSALSATMAGTPTILTVVSATQRSEGTVVRMRMPFFAEELAHLEQREVDVAFACADPRLLQTGTRWLGVVIGTSTVQANSVAAPLEQGRLWLAPGPLLPERSDIKRVLRLLPSVAIK